MAVIMNFSRSARPRDLVPPLSANGCCPLRLEASSAATLSSAELTRISESAKMPVFSEGYGRNDLQPAAIARFRRIAVTLAALPGIGGGNAHDEFRCVCGGCRGSTVRASDALEAASRNHRFVARPRYRYPLWSVAWAMSARSRPSRTRQLSVEGNRAHVRISLGESPSGKAPDFDSGIRRFDPYLPSHICDRRLPRGARPALRVVRDRDLRLRAAR